MPSKKARPSTRERILDAALDLFVEEGFSGATISEVERRVGLAAGTGSFYSHFSSKEALLHAAVAREVARCMAAAEHERASLTIPDDPRQQFAVLAQQTLRDLRRFDRLLRLMLSEGDRVPDVRKAITTALQVSGAVSWVDEPLTVVGVVALFGYHIFGLVGGPIQELGEDEFIEALSMLADGTGRLSLAPRSFPPEVRLRKPSR